jgi:hypothetical protein
LDQGRGLLRRTGAIRMLLEFDDLTRWPVTPARVERSFQILFGGV